jgi:hypothetical protein
MAGGWGAPVSALSQICPCQGLSEEGSCSLKTVVQGASKDAPGGLVRVPRSQGSSKSLSLRRRNWGNKGP